MYASIRCRRPRRLDVRGSVATGRRHVHNRERGTKRATNGHTSRPAADRAYCPGSRRRQYGAARRRTALFVGLGSEDEKNKRGKKNQIMRYKQRGIANTTICIMCGMRVYNAAAAAAAVETAVAAYSSSSSSSFGVCRREFCFTFCRFFPFIFSPFFSLPLARLDRLCVCRASVDQYKDVGGVCGGKRARRVVE